MVAAPPTTAPRRLRLSESSSISDCVLLFPFAFPLIRRLCRDVDWKGPAALRRFGRRHKAPNRGQSRCNSSATHSVFRRSGTGSPQKTRQTQGIYSGTLPHHGRDMTTMRDDAVIFEEIGGASSERDRPMTK